MKRTLLIVLSILLIVAFTGCSAVASTAPATAPVDNAQAASQDTAANAAATTDPFGSFMGIFFLAIGVYILYSAFTGKGKVYENEYPAEIKDSVFKMTRILCWFEGPILITDAAFEFKLFGEVPTFVSLIFIGLGLGLVVAYIVWLYTKHGKVLKSMRSAKNKMPNF